MTTEYPVISDDPYVQAHYLLMRENGEGHKLAEMCAMRAAPVMKGSDRAFLQGRHLTQGLDHVAAGRYLAAAKKAGISTHGKVYVSQLARKGLGPATPEAWVSGLDDVRDVCKKRGLGCENLGLKAVEAPPKKQVRLASDLVENAMHRELLKDPTQARDMRALKEKVIEKHGAKKKDGVSTIGVEVSEHD